MTRFCPICSNPLVKKPKEDNHKFSRRIYCGRPCQYKGLSQNQKRKLDTVKTCVVCTGEFHRREGELDVNYANRTTCSIECAAEWRGYHSRIKSGSGAIVCRPEIMDQLSFRQLKALAELPPDVRARLRA